MKVLNLIIAVVLTSFCCLSQTVNIKVTDIKNNKGQLLIGVYTNEKNYQAKQPIIWKAVPKTTVKDGVLTTSIPNLTPNIYGLALMDDEDKNWKMNFIFFIPTEGFAFSNYYHKGVTEPAFDDFKFYLSQEDKTIIMKMRYI
ncbi:MAG: DUF2141 domain-containing protein [Flavobacteriales bacterium]|jgi:uncharacterized protein (DUF2141 family)|nr:DUF2141 domain-containing protein [Flavobacteriales bacterium]